MLLKTTVKKLNGMSFERDFTKLPATSQHYIASYGFNQCIADPLAGIKRADFDSDKAYDAAVGTAVAKRLEQIDSGNVPGTRAPADPRTAKIRKVVAELAPVSDEEFDELLAEFVASRRAA
jgi:hypothetical protein